MHASLGTKCNSHVMTVTVQYYAFSIDGREIPREDDGEVPFKINLGTILSFATGADHVPPLGFPRVPLITFISDESRHLPTASTCGPTLSLPLQLVNYDDFKRNVDIAIICAHGFGSV